MEYRVFRIYNKRGTGVAIKTHEGVYISRLVEEMTAHGISAVELNVSNTNEFLKIKFLRDEDANYFRLVLSDNYRLIKYTI